MHADPHIQGDDGETCWIVHSDDIETLRRALADSGTDRAWPDIGTDPMQGARPADRYEAAAAACRTAYVQQQSHVPDQTALVWRWHLGALLEEHLRLRVLLDRNKPIAQPDAVTSGMPADGQRA